MREKREDFGEALRLFTDGLGIARDVNAMTGDAESAYDIALSLSCLGRIQEAQEESVAALSSYSEAAQKKTRRVIRLGLRP